MAWEQKRSRHERGYGTAWEKLRLQILQRDSCRCRCAECIAGNRIRPAHEVDHVVNKADWLRRHGSLDGVDHPDNLAAINRDCHRRKSQAESGRAQRIVGCDADGWPIQPEPAGDARAGVAPEALPARRSAVLARSGAAEGTGGDFAFPEVAKQDRQCPSETAPPLRKTTRGAT